MSTSDDLARETLEERVISLDNAIEWHMTDLVDATAGALRLRVTLDELRTKRTALLDAIRVHFPVTK